VQFVLVYDFTDIAIIFAVGQAHSEPIGPFGARGRRHSPAAAKSIRRFHIVSFRFLDYNAGGGIKVLASFALPAYKDKQYRLRKNKNSVYEWKTDCA
jgi:hypothetical protein